MAGSPSANGAAIDITRVIDADDDGQVSMFRHQAWPFENKVKGMTEDVARRSIDWLHDKGCRVLALMGGEPLLQCSNRAGYQMVNSVQRYRRSRRLSACIQGPK
jgi:hypothetical protein